VTESLELPAAGDLLAFGRRVLAQQPFSVLLGTRLQQLEPGRAVLTLALDDRLRQQHGFAHGGVISYLADNGLAYVGGSVLGNVVTSEYKINYLRPATGQQLVARATILSASKRQAVCECRVYAVDNEDEKLVAVAQGTIARVG